MTQQLIRLQEVMTRTGLSRSAVYELAQRGELPPQIKLSDRGRSVAWIASEIDQFIEQRIAASRGKDGAA
ncbi:MAG: AlpA family phage regulatory protein [Thiobacillus sp.]|nr:AlpA family phage regulatory protein [Thiobacillus sp.]